MPKRQRDVYSKIIGESSPSTQEETQQSGNIVLPLEQNTVSPSQGEEVSMQEGEEGTMQSSATAKKQSGKDVQPLHYDTSLSESSGSILQFQGEEVSMQEGEVVPCSVLPPCVIDDRVVFGSRATFQLCSEHFHLCILHRVSP